MGPIGGGPYYDTKYVGWWTRNFSSPKCPHCGDRMEEVEFETHYPTWRCDLCEWFTMHRPKPRKL